MKRLFFILFVLLCCFEYSSAQSSHGVIRRRQKTTTSKPKTKTSQHKKVYSSKQKNNHYDNKDVATNVSVSSQSNYGIKILSINSTTSGLYITMSVVNMTGISIPRDTYVITNNESYKIKGIYGLQAYGQNFPQRTYFPLYGKKKNFTLIFSPIPPYIRMINLYGGSEMSFSGITWSQ